MMQPTAMTTDHSTTPALATYAQALLDAVYPLADAIDPDIASFRQQVLAVLQEHSTQPDAVNTAKVQQVIQQLQSIANEREGAFPTQIPLNTSNTTTASHVSVDNQSTFSSQVSYSFGTTIIINPPSTRANDPVTHHPADPQQASSPSAPEPPPASNSAHAPHPLALPLAKLYQRLAFIHLPVFESPQSLANSYVHLMLIHQARPRPSAKPEDAAANTSDSVTSPWLNRYRSYEDIYALQAEVPPETLCQDPSRAIVIGRAGVGKSTFCRYGLYRWSLQHHPDHSDNDNHQSPWWTQYHLVFWIPLRSLLSFAPDTPSPSRRLDETDLAALICYVIESQPEAMEDDFATLTLTALIEVLNNKSLNILYLLDGFDEVERLLCQTDNENSHQANLVKYQINLVEYLLRKKAYVLTLRPHAMETAMTYQPATQALPLYELMGFANEDIPHYVEQAFRLNLRPAKEGERLLQQLEANISMWSAAHTPILLALLCALWEEDLIPLHKTLTRTQLYALLVERLLGHNLQQLIQASGLSTPQKRRLLERYNYKTSKTSLALLQPVTALTPADENEGLTQLLQPVYRFLSKVAFIALQQNNLMLRDDFLVNQLDATDVAALKQLFTTVGYGTDMQEVRTRAELLPWLGRLGMLHALPAGHRRHYEFLHLSFQEYLAAYYLTDDFILQASGHSAQHLDTLIADLVGTPAWQIVLAFIAGQLHQRAPVVGQDKLAHYLALLAQVPAALPKAPSRHCAKGLLEYPDVLPHAMIQRTLLLAYAWEESELAAIPEKALILAAMKACGTRALLFPRDFPAYRQARLSIVQAFKLCPNVFAASGLLDRLQSPKDSGIVLPETVYLAQAALLQITERRTLAGLITLLQNALNAQLVTVQLQIIDDLWSWVTTLPAREAVTTALGLCLCSSAPAVRDKARAYLAKSPLPNQAHLLQQAARLALHTTQPSVKIKAALTLLQDTSEDASVWQALLQALSTQQPAFLTDVEVHASELDELPQLSANARLSWQAKTIGWLLTHRVLDPDDHDRVEKLLPNLNGLQPLLLADWRVRLRARNAIQVKLAILQHLAQFYPWEEAVLAVVLEMLAAEEMSIRAKALNLIQSVGLQASAIVIQAHTCHLHHADPRIKQEAMQALSTLAPAVVEPSMLAAVCHQLSDEDFNVRQAALTTLARWGLDKTAAVIQTHRDNCRHTKTDIRQTASEMLIALANTEPQAIDGLQQLLSNTNSEIRQRAAAALIQLHITDQSVIDALQRNLKTDSTDTRQAAANALIQLQITDQSVIDALQRNLIHNDTYTRQTAADALSRLALTTPRAIDALRLALSDRRVYIRQTAADALIRLQITDQPVIDALQRNLIHDDTYTRQIAADALSRLAPTEPHAIDALRLALSDRRAYIRQTAADTLIRLEIIDHNASIAYGSVLTNWISLFVPLWLKSAWSWLRASHSTVIDALQCNLSDGSAYNRQAAADTLIRLAPTVPGAIDALRHALSANDAATRQTAVNALIRLAPTVPSAIDALRLALNDDRADTRQAAAAALIQLQITDQPVIDALQLNLKNDSAYTRQAAADALIRLQVTDQSVIDALQLNLKNDSAYTRQAAADALIQLQVTDQPVIDALQLNLNDYSAHLQQRAANALIRLGSTVPSAIDALRLALNDDRADTRQIAADALIQLQVTDQSVIDALQLNLKNDSAYTRQAAATTTLIRLGSTVPSAIDALRLALNDDRADTRQIAADALIQLQVTDQPVIDALRSNLNGDGDTRQAAADALIRLQITDQPVIDALRSNLNNYNANIRQAAADALIRLQITDQPIIDALRRNLDVKDANIRQKAAAALHAVESNTFSLLTPPSPQPANRNSYQRISSTLVATATTTGLTPQNDLPSPSQPVPVPPPALDQNVILANYHVLQQQPKSTAYQQTDSFDDELVYSDPEEEFSENDEQDEDASSQANLG